MQAQFVSIVAGWINHVAFPQMLRLQRQKHLSATSFDSHSRDRERSSTSFDIGELSAIDVDYCG